jgi:hypothetical protein
VAVVLIARSARVSEGSNAGRLRILQFFGRACTKEYAGK